MTGSRRIASTGRWRTLAAGALILVVAGLAGCAAQSQSTDPNRVCDANDREACSSIGGFPIGQKTADCGPTVNRCGAEGTLAFRGLQAWHPAHPAIARATLFAIDMRRACDGVACFYSSEHAVVVFDFTDGSTQAVGYECVGIDPCAATQGWHDFAAAVTSAPAP